MSTDFAQMKRLLASGKLEYPYIAPPPRREPAKRVGQVVRPAFAGYLNEKSVMEAMAALEVKMDRNMRDAVVGKFYPEAQVEPTPAPKPAPEPEVTTRSCCPGHTRRVFDMETFPAVAEWAAKEVLAHKLDAIVACGHSGLVLAGAVSVLTKVPVIAVRKEGERSVAAAPHVSAILSNGPAKRWGWIDDLIGSGGTMLRSIRYAQREDVLTGHFPTVALLYCVGGADEYTTTEISSSRWTEIFPELEGKGPFGFNVKRFSNR